MSRPCTVSRNREWEASMKVHLEGRVALVTGAARNIGKSIADTLAENGARVAYTDVLLDEARAAADAKTGCIARRLDVTDETDVERVVQEIASELGGLDIVVNNAGVNTLAHRVPIDEFPTEEWDRIVGVDLRGLYLVSKSTAGIMRANRKGGRIINIASVFGLVPARLQCAFVAAKAGVVNLTRAMALELGPEKILVNGIAPGSILTEGTKKLFYGEDSKFRESLDQMIAHIPLGRPGELEEIACAALFLSSPTNTYMNGHVLVVDGGWTAGYARDF